MLHLESFTRYSKRSFSFDDAIDYIDMGIRRFTGGPFKIRIEISQESQSIHNFPHDKIPDFLKKWDYPTKKENDMYKDMYTCWKIKFDYFWQHDQKVGNKYLAKQLFGKIKELPQEYWSDAFVSMGLKSNGNETYLRQEGQWLIIHFEPNVIYHILDKYFEREVDAPARKAWAAELSIQQMNKLVNGIELEMFDPSMSSFFK